jgi:hypothetical protein
MRVGTSNSLMARIYTVRSLNGAMRLTHMGQQAWWLSDLATAFNMSMPVPSLRRWLYLK